MNYLDALLIGFWGFVAGSMAASLFWLLLAFRALSQQKAGKR